MKNDEFRNLKHGDKIQSPDGLNFIVHNNHRSGSGMVVVVRTEVIRTVDCSDWKIIRKLDLNIGCGTYQVTIDKQIS